MVAQRLTLLTHIIQRLASGPAWSREAFWTRGHPVNRAHTSRDWFPRSRSAETSHGIDRDALSNYRRFWSSAASSISHGCIPSGTLGRHRRLSDSKCLFIGATRPARARAFDRQFETVDAPHHICSNHFAANISMTWPDAASLRITP